MKLRINMFFKKEDKEILNQILQNLLHAKPMVDESFKEEMRQSLGTLSYLIEHPSWLEEYKSCSRDIVEALNGLVYTIKDSGPIEEALLREMVNAEEENLMVPVKKKIVKKAVKPKKKSATK